MADVTRNLKDFATGESLTMFLAVRKAAVSTARNGSSYLDLRVSDGATELPAKQWDYAEEPPKENTVIKILANMDSYQGQPQLLIQKWRPAEPGEYETSQFIPVCPRDRQEMWEELINEHLCLIQDARLFRLVNETLGEYKASFMDCPAAMGHHHPYLGGLLEHTLGVLKLALKMAPDGANRELLMAGAILHDLGKIREYEWSGCSITRTTEGILIGHIAIEVMMLKEYYQRPFYEQLEEETFNLLLHLLVSHHGKLEWGSPVEPRTKEAMILHQADVLDVQMWKINQGEAQVGEGSWTPRIYGLGREFYVGSQKQPEPEMDYAKEPEVATV